MKNKFCLLTLLIIVVLATTSCSKRAPSESVSDSAANNNAPLAEYESKKPAPESSRARDLRTQDLPGKTASSYKSGASADNSMYLPVESKFISNNSMLVDAVGNALQSKRFDSIARSFESDSAKDGNALSLTNAYRQAITRQLGPGDKLVTFSCGLSLCIGALRTTTPTGYDTWVSKFFSDRATPSFSYAHTVVELAENYHENRFFFSTDPAANAMSGIKVTRPGGR